MIERSAQLKAGCWRATLLLACGVLLLPGVAHGAPADLDPTFGSGGMVQTFVGNEAKAFAAVLQPDGKIVVGGNGRTARNYPDYILARFNADGSLDPTFGNGGIVVTDLNRATGPADEIHALLLQPDGKIVAVGSARTTNGTLVSTGIVRYQSDGSLDPTFGSGGIVLLDNAVDRAAVLQPDGKIVCGGGGFFFAENNFQLTRLNPDGSPDASFGKDGQVTIDFNGSADGIFGLALQPDHKIVAAGVSSTAPSDGTSENFATARLLPDGSLDSSFGLGGKVTTDFANLSDYAFSVAAQPDGKIILAGRAEGSTNNWDFGLVRYNADGSLDQSFGNGGKLLTPFGVGDAAYAVKLQPDGKIVAAGVRGGSSTSFAVARYGSDGAPDTTFGGTGNTVVFFQGLDEARGLLVQPDRKIVAIGTARGGASIGDFALVRFLGDSQPAGSFANAGFTIVSAGPNGMLDPGETVTVALRIQAVDNSGGCTTSAFTGTLGGTGGATDPTPPSQNYGAICAGGPAVTRNFTFTVSPSLACGTPVTVSLSLQDGAFNYGTLAYSLPTGSLLASFAENFDGVAAPALPVGWTTTFSGSGTAATTSTSFPDTAPNDIFLSVATAVGLSEVATPTIALPGGAPSQLSFRNLFNTERNSDGLVLEISINGGPSQDILAAGGTFVSGGYNSTLGTSYSNPLPGRMAWSGLSGGTASAPAYITSVVNLPSAASGQNIRLRWRQGSNGTYVPGFNPGSRIDTITVRRSNCAPIPQAAVARKLHNGVPYDVALPLNGPMGVESRTAGPGGSHQVVVTFGSAVSVGGHSIIGDGGVAAATRSVSGGVVTLDLNGVANAQALGITLMNVNDGTNVGDVFVPMGVLLGDTSGNGSVTASDISQAKASSGQPISTTNFRADINANGSINSSDIGLVKSQSGMQLPR